MRLRGFALSEAMVALAVGSLAVGSLLVLNIDLVRLARRVDLAVKRGSALDALGRATELTGDPCTPNVRVFAAGSDGVTGRSTDSSRSLSLERVGATTIRVVDPGRTERAFAFPDRPMLKVRSALNEQGDSIEGLSVAFVELPDGGGASLATRCDLPEHCAYDTVAGACRKD